MMKIGTLIDETDVIELMGNKYLVTEKSMSVDDEKVCHIYYLELIELTVEDDEGDLKQIKSMIYNVYR